MIEHYHSKLSKKEQMYYRKLLEAVQCGESIVKEGPFMDSDAVTRVATAVNYDHPELFYVDFRHLNFLGTPTGIIYQVNYTVKAALRKSIIDEIERSIDTVLSAINKENFKGDYEKCRWIHNYLVKNIKYNYDALRQPDNYPDSFSVCGVFRDKLAVCEGISKAFKILCDRMDVDTLIAFGTSSLEGIGTGIPHAWNIASLSGQFCHIDVTWDIGMSTTSKYTRYDYFCLSDNYMKRDHVYEGLPGCTTDSLCYFRKRNRWFSNGRHLQEYLEAELKKGSTVLYFRAESTSDKVEPFIKKVQEQVNRAVSEFSNSSYYIEMVPNEKQMCFFFRISKQ